MADYSYGYKCVNNMAAGPKTLRKSPDPINAVGGVWARDYQASSFYRVFQVSGENQSINVIKHVIRASN